MGFFQKFPYTDVHQLNLDWILRLFKTLQGGTTGQLLKKKTNKDYDWEWSNTDAPSPSSTTPIMDGTAAIGVSDNYARADHVHPSDTSKADVSSVHSVPPGGDIGKVLGKASAADYDLVWLSAGGGGGGNDVEWFTYGVSTSAEIEVAYQTGKICMVINGSRAFILGIRASATSHTFYSATYGTVYQVKCDNDSWTNNSRSIPVAATDTPANLGNAAVGSSAKYAKEDHVHETELAWFTYNTSTSAQIEAAFQAGKVCLATHENDSRVYILSDRISATDHVFTAGTGTRLYNIECNNGTWTSGSRLIPASASTTPAALGTASAGSASTVSRSDHVHPMPSASEVGAMGKWEKVWVNASPTSSFAAQTVSVDLSAYDLVAVYACESDSATGRCNMFIVQVGDSGNIEFIINARQCRRFDVASTGVTFGGGNSGPYNGAVSSSDTSAIPRAIYGIKGVI